MALAALIYVAIAGLIFILGTTEPDPPPVAPPQEEHSSWDC
jgi:hypothetical protein